MVAVHELTQDVPDGGQASLVFGHGSTLKVSLHKVNIAMPLDARVFSLYVATLSKHIN
jgi:hypothetical protein